MTFTVGFVINGMKRVVKVAWGLAKMFHPPPVAIEGSSLLS